MVCGDGDFLDPNPARELPRGDCAADGVCVIDVAKASGSANQEQWKNCPAYGLPQGMLRNGSVVPRCPEIVSRQIHDVLVGILGMLEHGRPANHISFDDTPRPILGCQSSTVADFLSPGRIPVNQSHFHN